MKGKAGYLANFGGAEAIEKCVAEAIGIPPDHQISVHGSPARALVDYLCRAPKPPPGGSAPEPLGDGAPNRQVLLLKLPDPVKLAAELGKRRGDMLSEVNEVVPSSTTPGNILVIPLSELTQIGQKELSTLNSHLASGLRLVIVAEEEVPEAVRQFYQEMNNPSSRLASLKQFQDAVALIFSPEGAAFAGGAVRVSSSKANAQQMGDKQIEPYQFPSLAVEAWISRLTQ